MSEPSPASLRSRLILGFATIYLIWGSTYLGIRVAVETMPPFLMAGIRYIIAGGLMLGVLLLRGAKWPTLAQWRDCAIVGACLFLGGNGTVCWGEQQVPSGLASLLIGGGPVIMVFLDWARPNGVRPTAATCLGMAVGSAGLFFLVDPLAPDPDHLKPSLVRILVIVLGTICWWIGSLYGRHAKSGGATLVLAATQMLCGGICSTAAGLIGGEGPLWQWTQFSAQSWIAFGYLIALGSLVAFPVYTWLLKASTPARLSTFAYINPIVAVILGWAILGETVTIRTVASGAVIIAAVVIITAQKNKAAGLSRS